MEQTNSWTPMAGLCHWEREQPDTVYLTQPTGGEITTYTWAETADQVRRIAAHLASLDLPEGSRVALVSKNCAHWVMAHLAILMAGHVSVPIYSSANRETVGYVLDHSEARVLILGSLDHWDDVREGIPDGLPIIALPRAPVFDPPRENLRAWDDLVAITAPMRGEPLARAGTDLATLVYTSGSTGKPKGVMLGFGALAVGACLANNIVPVGPDDRLISYLPLAHVFEQAVVLMGSLRFGCQLFFNESLLRFATDIERARPTIFLSVPRLWVKFQLGVLQKLPQEKLSALLADPRTAAATQRRILEQLGLDQARIAITGSAPLPQSVVEWYRALGLEMLEGYGMSEDFCYSHVSLPGRTRVGYVGHPHPGVERRIGEGSEILIKSKGAMLGYFRDPELTRAAFTEDGFFRTGDMGEIDEDGRLRITGRVKEIFKTSKGKYVAPAPIEERLISHPGIEVACVMGAGMPQPFGLLMLNAEARGAFSGEAGRARLEEELEALRRRVNAALEDHERLDFLAISDEQWTIANGYLTPTMKVRRNVIEKRYEPRFESWYDTRRAVIWA
ncbi:AMP-binding protein [Paracoccus marinaquae]|uniref:AMP-binding protein n=1 Tax=Paracoccus marinaquae TaxID=2841926 RepID=A0ABS6AF79_9RHOB|nr:AMP-binding protein [Paracoccus marinaquae]MBU3029258.1 AMP-binding protein [Paracoccus marinaquae]